MELKRILSLLLSCLLCLSLVACDQPTQDTANSDTQQSDTETEATETTDTEAPKVIETKTYKLTEILSNIKALGRTTTAGNGLACDFSGSGIEFNAYVEGAITLKVAVSKGVADGLNDDCYFTLYIDGVRQEQRLKAAKSSTTTLTLATFDEGGVHNIRLVKQTEPRNSITVLNDLSFTGYFEAAPEKAPYRIEFLGASILSGYGNLISGGGAAEAQKAVNQDVTQAFTYLTAEALGADCSIVSASGLGLVRGYRSFSAPSLFSASSLYRSEAEKYTPTEPVDLVVINLAGNDKGKNVTVDEWKSAAFDLMATVRQTYGADTAIVWVYVTTSPYFPEVTEELVNMLGGSSDGLYVCKLTQNTAGGNNHPDLAGHLVCTQELTQFILENNILK